MTRIFLRIACLICLLLGVFAPNESGLAFLILAVFWNSEANHYELMEKLDEL